MSAADFILVRDPAGFRSAAKALAAGQGAFAIDTERASAYRYDDRAFLVQVRRRDAGTFLIAPEGHRGEFSDIFGPVISGTDWIVHAAPEDLPSLAELSLFPSTVFDTALAGRIAGFAKPNLGAMVAQFCGVELDKGHGREDWSRTPLPAEWQLYAADDVNYLHDLAEAQAELLDLQGKSDIAEQEFAHIVHTYANWKPEQRSWRDTKGIAALGNRTSLALVQALWTQREKEARGRDISPAMILNSKVLMAIAKAQPRTVGELAAVQGFPARRRGAAQKWFRVLEEVYRADPASWPRRQRAENGTPGKSAWQRHHPESWEVLQTMRSAIAEAAADIEIPPEVVLTPAILREAVWTITNSNGLWDTHAIAELLADLGARPWQVAEVAPLFTANGARGHA